MTNLLSRILEAGWNVGIVGRTGAILVTLSLTPGRVGAQEVQVRTGGPVGCSCELEIHKVAVITGSEVGTSTLSAAFDEGRGLLFLNTTTYSEYVFVYDLGMASRADRPDPVIISAPVDTVGRRGDGPAEFRRVGPVAAFADTLYVADRFRRRLTVFDPDFDVVRTLRLEGLATPWGLDVGAEGIFIQMALITDPEGPLTHQIDGTTGATLRSFGRRNPDRRRLEYGGLRHAQRVLLDDHGHLVTSWPRTLELAHYDLETGRNMRYRRSVQGKEASDPEEDAFSRARTPQGDRRLDERSITAATVPLNASFDAFRVPGPGFVGMSLSIPTRAQGVGEDSHERYLELWDIESGQVLTSLAVTTGFLRAVQGGPFLLHPEEDPETAAPIIEVWRVSIRYNN